MQEKLLRVIQVTIDSTPFLVSHPIGMMIETVIRRRPQHVGYSITLFFYLRNMMFILHVVTEAIVAYVRHLVSVSTRNDQRHISTNHDRSDLTVLRMVIVKFCALRQHQVLCGYQVLMHSLMCPVQHEK